MPNLKLRAIQIQTIDYCNRSCSFCPNASDARKSKESMDDDLFTTILERISEYNYDGRISPYLMNEPFCDNRILDKIKEIKTMFPNNYIFLNTNGDHIFSLDDWSGIISSGLNGIQVNTYGNRDMHNRRLKKLLDLLPSYDNLKLVKKGSIRNCTNLENNLLVKMVWTPSAKPSFWNRGGNVPNWNRLLPTQSPSNICTFLFEQMYINYRGEAVLCCSDWHHEIVMGNLKHQTIEEIWLGKRYREYRQSHESGHAREMKLCSTCDLI